MAPGWSARLAASRSSRRYAPRGAVAAIDYSEPDWTGRVLARLGGEHPAVVLDEVGGQIGRAAFAITADGGVFSAHGAALGDSAPLDDDAARERGITVRRISDVQFSPEEGDRRLRDVLAQAAPGRVAPGVSCADIVCLPGSLWPRVGVDGRLSPRRDLNHADRRGPAPGP